MLKRFLVIMGVLVAFVWTGVPSFGQTTKEPMPAPPVSSPFPAPAAPDIRSAQPGKPAPAKKVKKRKSTKKPKKAKKVKKAKKPAKSRAIAPQKKS